MLEIILYSKQSTPPFLKREKSTSVNTEGSCNKMAKRHRCIMPYNKKAKSTRLNKRKKGIKEVFTSL